MRRAPALASPVQAGPARVSGIGDGPGLQGGGSSSLGAGRSAVILSAATNPVTSMLNTRKHVGEALGEYVLYRF